MYMENCLEKEIVLPKGVVLKAVDAPVKTVTVREVVGFDEEAISQPQFKKDPSALIIELIHRCLVKVGDSDKIPPKTVIRTLPTGFLDTLLIEIRMLTVGSSYELTAFCPGEVEEGNGKVRKCKKPYEAVVDLQEVLDSAKKDSYSMQKVTLTRGIVNEKGERMTDLVVKFADGVVQQKILAMQDENSVKFGEANTDLIHLCCVSINGNEVTKEMIQSMSSADRRQIAKVLQKAPGPDVQHECECAHCGNTWKQTINVLDFLA